MKLSGLKKRHRHSNRYHYEANQGKIVAAAICLVFCDKIGFKAR